MIIRPECQLGRQRSRRGPYQRRLEVEGCFRIKHIRRAGQSPVDRTAIILLARVGLIVAHHEQRLEALHRDVRIRDDRNEERVDVVAYSAVVLSRVGLSESLHSNEQCRAIVVERLQCCLEGAHEHSGVLHHLRIRPARQVLARRHTDAVDINVPCNIDVVRELECRVQLSSRTLSLGADVFYSPLSEVQANDIVLHTYWLIMALQKLHDGAQ